MFRKIVFIVFTGLIISGTISAQKKSDKNSAALGAIIGIGALALEFHQILEMLETKALNYVIENHPEMESFRLKVLDLEGKKMSDIGAMGVLTFRITQLDKQTGDEKERAILMMFTSKGWMTEHGIDLRLVSWKKMDKTEWNDLYVNFVALNSITPINKTDFTGPTCIKVQSTKYNAQDSLHYIINNKYWICNPGVALDEDPTSPTYGQMIPSEQSTSIIDVEVKRSGLSKYFINENGVRSSYLFLPFITLKNDDYRVADYSEEFKLFANEHSMGLFMKNTNETIQLKRQLVNKIHQFLNSIVG